MRLYIFNMMRLGQVRPRISLAAPCPPWYIAIPRHPESRQTEFAFMVQFLVFLLGEVWYMFTRVFCKFIDFSAVG